MISFSGTTGFLLGNYVILFIQFDFRMAQKDSLDVRQHLICEPSYYCLAEAFRICARIISSKLA